MNSQQWITTKKLAEIKNVSERAVRKSIQKNKYVVRKCSRSYEILITSLEENVREKLTLEDEKQLPVVIENIEVPESEKKLALAKFELIQKWNEYRNGVKKHKTEAGKEFLQMYNQKLLHTNLFDVVGSVAIGTIYQWNKNLIKNDNNWHSLVNNYTFGEKTIKTKLKPYEEQMFLSYLLNPNQYNIGKAIKMTKYCLEKRGITDFSCDMSYRRFAKKYQKEHYDTWVFAREGSKALKDKVIPYIPRDISMLEVGDVLIADGHRLAINILNPFTGKPARPMLIVYQDWKSTALVGFEIMFEESTQAIASALRNSIINLGKIPQFCYQDNGKAFKAEYFEGISGLFANLGITSISAQPYNAKAKPIERFFREIQDTFERLFPSFVGSNVYNKPAYLKRNEKFHAEHHNEYIPTVEETIQVLNKWLDFHYSQSCPHVKGKTIGEVFESGKGSGVDISRLDDLMMVQEIKNIRRNGITFLKFDYYDPTLYGLREQVIIKYSLFDLSEIKVYLTNGKYLCTAKRVESSNPLANYIGAPKDIEDVKQKIKLQKNLEKQTVKNYMQELKRERACIPLIEDENLYISVEEEKEETMQMIANEEVENTIFMSDFKRFEYLKDKNNLTTEEKSWIKAYEKTDEYEQIYGEMR